MIKDLSLVIVCTNRMPYVSWLLLISDHLHMTNYHKYTTWRNKFIFIRFWNLSIFESFVYKYKINILNNDKPKPENIRF